MKSFKQHVKMVSEAPMAAKGWVNAKAKKADVSPIRSTDVFHVTLIAKDPERYGLTKQEIVDWLDVNDWGDDPEREYENLVTGKNDVMPEIESMAMNNGWVRFAVDDYGGEITAESWKDVQEAAKFILKHSGMKRIAEAFLKPPKGGTHLRVRRFGSSGVASKTLTKDTDEFTKWAFGREADANKAVKQKGGLTDIGSTMARFREDVVVEGCGCGCNECGGEEVTEAEYQGRKVNLNEPFRTPGKNKKFAVYTKNESGKVVIVRFGDPNMEINRDDAKARANFRSRHSCDDDPGPKWKARYWSCYQWRAGAPVDD